MEVGRSVEVIEVVHQEIKKILTEDLHRGVHRARWHQSWIAGEHTLTFMKQKQVRKEIRSLAKLGMVRAEKLRKND